MLMSALELSTAVQQQLPVTYVILNDDGLGMVRHGQRLAGAPSIAHDIAPVRFDALAHAVGPSSVRVETRGELAQVPSWFLAADSGGPCLIDVRIDREAVPPMADRVLALASKTCS
jgi:acetolactate synthase-1/2/3 large subunit